MQAMIYENYGSPARLKLQAIDQPTIQEDEVLVKAYAGSLNWLDWHFLTGTPLLARLMAGFLKPKQKVLGIDLAGRVEAVGNRVTTFKPGDEVFGATSGGCFAEFVRARPAELQIKPANLSFEAAAAVGAAASTALHGLRDQGQLESGQKVLINGASGGVGTFAVQMTRSLGGRVTGVCGPSNLDLVRSLGAECVLDYTQVDFAGQDDYYDLIFDVAATRSFAECRRALKPDGTYVTSAFSPVLALRAKWSSSLGNQKMAPLAPKPPSQQDLMIIKELLEAGKIKPVIDRCYPLAELPEALHYLSDGHARGKIVITIEPGERGNR